MPKEYTDAQQRAASLDNKQRAKRLLWVGQIPGELEWPLAPSPHCRGQRTALPRPGKHPLPPQARNPLHCFV